MANMSYCRFRNTLADLKDCANNMDKPEAAEEIRARKLLIQLCVRIANEYGDEVSE